MFVSHASEDKDAIARPLANELRERGLSVWFDEAELVVGESLQRQIDDGLRHAAVGAVILSPNFFAKGWPQRELRALIERELAGEPVVVLPVWHEVSAADVRAYDLALVDKVAVSADKGPDVVADEIVRSLRKHRDGARRPREVPAGTARSRRTRRRVAAALLAVAVVAGVAVFAASGGDGGKTPDTGPSAEGAVRPRPTVIPRIGRLEPVAGTRIVKRGASGNAYVLMRGIAHPIPNGGTYICSAWYYPAEFNASSSVWNRRVRDEGVDARCPEGPQPELSPRTLSDRYLLLEHDEKPKDDPRKSIWLVVDGKRVPVPLDGPTFECLTRRYLVWDYVSRQDIARFPRDEKRRRVQCRS